MLWQFWKRPSVDFKAVMEPLTVPKVGSSISLLFSYMILQMKRHASLNRKIEIRQESPCNMKTFFAHMGRGRSGTTA